MNLTKQKGFTLIELMIVVAIIGILASIAIPQFAKFRVKAFDSAAASDAKNGVTTFEAFYTDEYAYPDAVAVTTSEGPLRVTLANNGTATSNYWNFSDGVICGSLAATGKYGIGCKHTGGATIYKATDATPSVKAFTGTEGVKLQGTDRATAGVAL